MDVYQGPKHASGQNYLEILKVDHIERGEQNYDFICKTSVGIMQYNPDNPNLQ